MKEEERKRVIEVSKSSIWKLKKENIIKVLGNCNGQLSFFFLMTALPPDDISRDF